MSIVEETLLSKLPKLKKTGRFLIAYSGGMDSHVLLSALCKVLPSEVLLAIHIDHGLSPNSDAWQAHCQQVCNKLGIMLKTHKVTIEQGSSASLENLAREARYAVFQECVAEDDFLLMAHHCSDQAETMLYRLLRGTGTRGLAGIPAQRSLEFGSNKVQLLRPLLDCSQAELDAYAKAQGLKWIEDESNQNTDFDRNFLRKEVIPKLSQRWPGFEKRWLRTARLCGEAEQLQTLLGEQDLRQVRTEYSDRLNITALMDFEDIRRRNILRVWFTQLQNEFGLPMPDYNSLLRIVDELCSAADDAEPLVTWSTGLEQVEARRFAGELYVLRGRAHVDSSACFCWRPGQQPALSLPSGTLTLEEVTSKGIEMDDIKEVKISFRQGGEQAKPAGRKTRLLKKIFQDYHVAPWLRDQLPLIYVDDELVAVADLFICENWQIEKGQKLYRFHWESKGVSGNL